MFSMVLYMMVFQLSPAITVNTCARPTFFFKQKFYWYQPGVQIDAGESHSVQFAYSCPLCSYSHPVSTIRVRVRVIGLVQAVISGIRKVCLGLGLGLVHTLVWYCREYSMCVASLT